MTAAGGLWTTTADLSEFLSFQLGDGTIGGRTVLNAAWMRQMRSIRMAPRAASLTRISGSGRLVSPSSYLASVGRARAG
jgi:CubicO group peptidase (beta-lactamase class C family)